MLKLLFLPGALFLLVIFFRVVVPYISTAPWKRIIDSALYHRTRKEFDKSDALLKKAVTKYPKQPEVYLDYFLNFSGSENLKDRFEVITEGYKKTEDTILGFFIASTYLEHGLLSEAEALLDTEKCREYMLKKGITLLPQLYYEQKNYKKAEEEFKLFYRGLYHDEGDFEDILKEMSPQDLIMLALIKKDSGSDYLKIMGYAPKTSVHTDMSWHDLLASLHEQLKNINPAEIGITGDPGEFNRRRKEYFTSRIKLIESYL
ncbi:MAG: hypothetical protein PQJ61_09925 [Spirochaetales bacterium]|uniref:Tetratricopeptide repeat protein n=1 Tax=Candidatus Thalassospirochaeta sargassi TaxID=3119039 RepID=A0AAJ1IH61_9SPIO|nr:hypothetical protein [Spirochaetales bacterium]